MLDGCSGLTDANLRAFAQRSPQLERLAIRNCPGMTVSALIKIVQQCPELRSLSFLTLR